MILNIGCFGAIRPLKNQLMQAMAAIEYANLKKCILHFHMNSGRIESGGECILENIQALFEHGYRSHSHKLILHPWMNHHDFLKLVRQMDLGMQVSFSETFCIVAADFISEGKPLVASSEVQWAGMISYADPRKVDSIRHAIRRNLVLPYLSVESGKWGLKKANQEAVEQWVHFAKCA